MDEKMTPEKLAQKEAAAEIVSVAVQLARARAKALFPTQQGPQNITTNIYFPCLLSTFFIRYYHMEGKKDIAIKCVIFFMLKYLEDRLGNQYASYALALPDTFTIDKEWINGGTTEIMTPTPYKVGGHNYGTLDAASCNGVYFNECQVAVLNIMKNTREKFNLELSKDALFRDAVDFCSNAYPFLKETFEKHIKIG